MIFGKLFGSSEVVEKTTDGILSGIDKAILTKEEQLDINMKLLKLYEPFKVAQRYLACIFSIPYVTAWVVTFGASMFGMDVTTQLELLNGDIGKVVGAIIAFYFLGGVVDSKLRK